MSTFTFRVVVEGVDVRSHEVVDALFNAGCDDALIGSCEGIQYLDFDREAASLDNAVRSAVAAIESVDGLSAAPH